MHFLSFAILALPNKPGIIPIPPTSRHGYSGWPFRLRRLGARVLKQFVRIYASWRLGSGGGVENAGVPSGQPGVSPYLCGVGVAGFGQLFDSVSQFLAPVVLGGGVPDVLLRLTKRRSWIDRYEFIVAAEQEVASVKVTVK
jgi:hypothetical protein